MKTLVKKLKKVLNKEIIDIILFGSLVKGKINPNDIDVFILSTPSIELKRKIKEVIPRADIQFLKFEDYNKKIWITLVSEGFSIRYNKFLHELYNIQPVTLFKYSLKELTNSKKVMFERALKNFTNITKLSNRVVLVPIEKSEEFKDLLKHWQIDIDSDEYNLLPIVRKREL